MASLVKRLINTPNAAKPVAPYSQAVIADRTVYVSGSLGLDKTTMQLVSGGIAQQTEMALKNLEAILIAADSGLEKVVKTTLWLKDLSDFDTVNEIYREILGQELPARSVIQVARLPLDALIEIECIALTGNVVTASN